MENEELQAQEIESRVYEVGFLLLPFVTEENLAHETEKIKEAITSAGGKVFSEEDPRMISLAYPMFKVVSNKKTKFESAYFGWVKFDGDPSGVSKIKKAMEAEASVLRFMIIKTVRENTLVRKPLAFASKPIKSAVKEEVKEEAPQVINEAELDKTIEDLVIE